MKLQYFWSLYCFFVGIDEGIDLDSKATLQPNLSEEEIERKRKEEEYKEELAKVFLFFKLSWQKSHSKSDISLTAFSLKELIMANHFLY